VSEPAIGYEQLAELVQMFPAVPSVGRVQIAPDVWQAVLATSRQPDGTWAPWASMGTPWGIPVEVVEALPPGGWDLLDADGNVVHSNYRGPELPMMARRLQAARYGVCVWCWARLRVRVVVPASAVVQWTPLRVAPEALSEVHMETSCPNGHSQDWPGPPGRSSSREVQG